MQRPAARHPVRPRRAARDSKDPEGPALLLDRGAWSSFVVGLRRGLHD
ncbi:DUF397 domain-containing protein [Micromonospora sp. NPDC020751]